MRTAIAVRRKDDPTAPLETITTDIVDVDHYDVVDEHGNPATEEQLQAIRDYQGIVVEEPPPPTGWPDQPPDNWPPGKPWPPPGHSPGPGWVYSPFHGWLIDPGLGGKPQPGRAKVKP